MKVAADSRQWENISKTYSSPQAEKKKTSSRKETTEKTAKSYREEKAEKDKALLDSFSERTKKAKENKNSNFSVKSSGQEESVGSYAARLANAETRMEVMEISSKVMRTLANLKMMVVSSDEKEAKKIAKKIKRLEKLMKKIQQKLKNLSKEELLERQKKQALKKMEIQKAKELHEKLESRRRKRHREERKYAQKELAEDRKSESDNPLSSENFSDIVSGEISMDLGGMEMSMASFEGGGIDISV